MKKLLFVPIIIILITVFSACKKASISTTPALGTITANIDGTPVSFNSASSATIDTIQGQYILTVGGYQTSASLTSNIIGVGIGGSHPIAVGTYTDTNSNSDSSFISYALPADSAGYGAVGIAPYFATVTITSLSSTQIQGTFSGTLGVASGSSAGSPLTHTITDGKFNLTITHL